MVNGLIITKDIIIAKDMSKIVIEPELLDVQKTAYRYLLDTITQEILFGGASGGGKSYLGCVWVISSALLYPGTRWLIGRAVLKNLKESTLVTLFDVMTSWGIMKDTHYEYNTKDNYVLFKKEYGGSRILLKDLFFYPSDPDYIGLGSLEVTGVFIDEAGEVAVKAREILSVRVRYKLKDFCVCGGLTKDSKVLEYDEFKQPSKWLCSRCKQETGGLIPKKLYSCNPSKNWTFYDFYRPYSDGTLQADRVFIPALATENKFNSKHYIDALDRLNPLDRKRLFKGEWDYGDDDYSLFNYDNILNLFMNDIEHGKNYITCDWAGLGKDKCVIFVWDGFKVIDYTVYDKSNDKMILKEIERLRDKYLVRIRDIVVDEMGGGQGIVSTLGCEGFIASETPVYIKRRKENYTNFRAQLYYKLSDMVNRDLVAIKIDDVTIRKTIIEELEQIRRPEKSVDEGNKLAIEGKDMIRERIGRSPDFSDALMMRMYFVVKKRRKYLI